MNLNVCLFTVKNWFILFFGSTSHILSTVTKKLNKKQEVGLHNQAVMMPVRFSSLMMSDTQTSLYMVVNTVNGWQSLVSHSCHNTCPSLCIESHISAGHQLDTCKHHKSQNWQVIWNWQTYSGGNIYIYCIYTRYISTNYLSHTVYVMEIQTIWPIQCMHKTS